MYTQYKCSQDQQEKDYLFQYFLNMRQVRYVAIMLNFVIIQCKDKLFIRRNRFCLTCKSLMMDMLSCSISVMMGLMLDSMIVVSENMGSVYHRKV